MSIRIPSRIKYLVDRRARLQGEEKRAINQLQLLEGRLIALRTRHEHESQAMLQQKVAVEAHLADLGKSMATCTMLMAELDVDIQNVPAISEQTSVRTHEYGEIRRSIVRCLAQDPMRRFTTAEIASYVAAFSTVPIVAENFTQFRLAVKDALKVLARKGRVQRHHLKNTTTMGTWSLGNGADENSAGADKLE